MKRSTQEAEALLESLVRASRTAPTARQTVELEKRLAPWLSPTPSATSPRWRVASMVAIAAVGVGLLAQISGFSSTTYGRREARSRLASPHRAFVRHEAPTATDRHVGTASPAIAPAAATLGPAHPPIVSTPVEDRAPVDEAPPPMPSALAVPPREPEVDFLRRAQALLEKSPADALVMADDHRSIYPRGVLVQEREVIAIDALVRLGRRSEAVTRAASFRRTFPRSAHASRVAALTEEQ